MFLMMIAFQVLIHSSRILQFNYHSAPITYCFTMNDTREIINRYELRYDSFPIRWCTSDYCKKVVRLCSEGENPYDENLKIVYPLCMALLMISLCASRVLQYFGDYENVYNLSKKLCRHRPIVHPSFLKDVFDQRPQPDFREDRLKLIKEAFGSDKNILKRKDCLEGETCLHTAAKNKLFDDIQLMIALGGDVTLKNNKKENVLDVLINTCKAKQEWERLQILFQEIMHNYQVQKSTCEEQEISNKLMIKDNSKKQRIT